MATERKPSARASRFWTRMAEWYGTRWTESYGPVPGVDWCEIIDGADNDTVRKALAEIRVKHTVHPPTLPELDAVITRNKAAMVETNGPTPQELLVLFVLRHRPLTQTQRGAPWTWLCKRFDAVPSWDPKHTHPGYGIEITGVAIPADGDYPGFRVMVEDMQLAAVA